MCIYLGNQNNLKYSSQEHIITAGLGGMSKLPIEYVSNEFNNYFSKYERQFLRNSILSIPRQILGPGKRGSLNSNKATKSLINVFKHTEKDQYSLGYIKEGAPFEIPHIVFNKITKQYSAGMDKKISDVDFITFVNKLKDFSNLKIKLISFPKLNDEFMIGIKGGIEDRFECFIAGANPVAHPFTDELLRSFSKLLESKDNFNQSDSYQIRTNQTARIDEDYFRCNAKVAFNVLAHLTNEEFVMKKEFDEFKNWLLKRNQENIDFAIEVPAIEKNIRDTFPEHSHYILIQKVDNILYANVVFYNYFNCLVMLCQDFPFPFDFNGFICDWKNKKEYRFFEYLNNRKNN